MSLPDENFIGFAGTIDQLVRGYESLLNESSDPPLSRPVTVRMPIEDISFAQAVADHYEISRSAFIQKLLESAFHTFFNALPSESRLSIAKSANTIFRSQLEKHVEERGGLYFRGVTKWLAPFAHSGEDFSKYTIEVGEPSNKHLHEVPKKQGGKS